jgi:hypothetical protein
MLDATYYLQPNYNVDYWVHKSLKTCGIPMGQEELEATNDNLKFDTFEMEALAILS